MRLSTQELASPVSPAEAVDDVDRAAFRPEPPDEMAKEAILATVRELIDEAAARPEGFRDTAEAVAKLNRAAALGNAEAARLIASATEVRALSDVRCPGGLSLRSVAVYALLKMGHPHALLVDPDALELASKERGRRGRRSFSERLGWLLLLASIPLGGVALTLDWGPEHGPLLGLLFSVLGAAAAVRVDRGKNKSAGLRYPFGLAVLLLVSAVGHLGGRPLAASLSASMTLAFATLLLSASLPGAPAKIDPPAPAEPKGGAST